MYTVGKSDFKPTTTDNGVIYTLNSIPDSEAGKTIRYPSNLDPNSAGVTIPDSFANRQFYIEVPTDKSFAVSIPSTTTADLKVGKTTSSSSTLQLPATSNANIYGAGKITIDQTGKEDSVAINKFYINPGSDVSFESTKTSLTMNELDVYGGEHNCKDQSKIGDNAYPTVCKLVKIEADSTLNAANMKFQEIKVGLRSILSMNTDNVDISNAPIILYYGKKNNYGNQNSPIVITGTKAPAKTGDITIVELEEGKPVPQEDENFSIADFHIEGDDDKGTKTLAACNQMLESFKGGCGFGNKQCVQDPDEKSYVRMLASKSTDDGKKKKKKLSGGAIAGIVIACVVVVAAIIALLVYFLVIKKKNDATTSTQGDSSIAI